MATIQSFEDLEIWKKAHEIAALIYNICNSNPDISKDFSFKDQIKRAALSISNNIAEGFEYNNNKDFYRFLRIAKGSCGEVKNCLLFSTTVNYTKQKEVEELINLCHSESLQIGGLMKYIKTKIKENKKPDTPNQTRNS